MYTTATRLLTILHLLHARTDKSMRGSELAEHLEVDTRTIRRYIMLLRDMGVEIDSAAGRYGTYSLPPRTHLPPSLFERDELEALLKALDAAENTPASERARQKIRRLLEP